MSLKCPCGLDSDYQQCCGRYIHADAIPLTAEALMRSRYTAYALGHIEYIKKTMKGLPLENFDVHSALSWSKSVYWLKLEILETKSKDDEAFVMFVASFVSKSKIHYLKEKSKFKRIDGQWYYTDGQLIPMPTRAISSNSPCYCQSGKKYKNCHAKIK
jgi:SEC-C motif-containing protein